MKALVLGGGVIGASIAHELARKGVSVTVVDQRRPGAASLAAGGMLAPQTEAAGPGPFFDLLLRSRALAPAWAEQLHEASGMPIGYMTSGLLQVAFTEAELHDLEATVAWQRASSLRATLLSGAEVREKAPGLSREALGAIELPDEHQLDPRRLMPALEHALDRAGVSRVSGAAERVLEEEGRITGAMVDGEPHHADVTIIATGAWTSGLTRLSVEPIRGQMARLAPSGYGITQVLKGAGAYVIPRADGRVVIGATAESVGFELGLTAGGLSGILAGAVRLVPALANVVIEETWAGFRPHTPDGMPILGTGPKPGLVFATGHFRNGILLAPITARVIGQVVMGEKPSVELRPFRYDRFGA